MEQSLIPCPECGRMVSPDAEECPNCGAPVRELLADKASTVQEEQNVPNCETEDADNTTETPNDEPTIDSTVGATSDSKGKKNGVMWILLALGVIIIAVCAFVFLRDDGSSTTQPYYVTYENSSNTTMEVLGEATAVANQTIETSEILSLHLLGRICSDNNASMTIRGERGDYHFINYTRTIKVHQYNAATGELVVYGYEQNTDKYIGKFEGTLTSSKYKGKFTNYKGVECTFDFDVKESDNSVEVVSAADFEYNAILTDKDGDFTNIRDANKNIVDKLPTGIRYRVYLDGYSGEGEWWYIRGGEVYDPTNGTIRKLKGDDWWIHNSCFTYID